MIDQFGRFIDGPLVSAAAGAMGGYGFGKQMFGSPPPVPTATPAYNPGAPTNYTSYGQPIYSDGSIGI